MSDRIDELTDLEWAELDLTERHDEGVRMLRKVADAAIQVGQRRADHARCSRIIVLIKKFHDSQVDEGFREALRGLVDDAEKVYYAAADDFYRAPS